MTTSNPTSKRSTPAKYTLPPVVERWYDFSEWLVLKASKFNKNYRYVLGVRIETTAFDILEYLTNAAMAQPEQKRAWVMKAQSKLEHIRFLLRLSHKLKLINGSGYEYAAGRVVEVGRMLGGWRKQLQLEP